MFLTALTLAKKVVASSLKGVSREGREEFHHDCGVKFLPKAEEEGPRGIVMNREFVVPLDDLHLHRSI